MHLVCIGCTAEAEMHMCGGGVPFCVVKQKGNGPINLRRQIKLVQDLLAASEATTTSKQPRRSNLILLFDIGDLNHLSYIF